MHKLKIYLNILFYSIYHHYLALHQGKVAIISFEMIFNQVVRIHRALEDTEVKSQSLHSKHF